MSKARNALERQIIEVSKKTTITTQQRVIEIGTLLSKLEDTIAREREQHDEEQKTQVVPRTDYEKKVSDLLNARNLICDIWASYPQTKNLLAARTGPWFGFGHDRETDYFGKDLSGTPEAAEESGPSMILSRAELLEIFTKHKFEPIEVDYQVAEEILEAAWNKATPSSRWKVTGEEDPHKGKYDGERSELAMGRYTDDELANGAFLNYDRKFNVEDVISGRQIAPISWMTGVKDRIRWLSRSLEKALAKAKTPQDEAILGQIDKLKAGERIGLVKPLKGDSLLIELGNTDFHEILGLIPSKEIVVNRESMIKAIGTDDIDAWFNQQLAINNG